MPGCIKITIKKENRLRRAIIWNKDAKSDKLKFESQDDGSSKASAHKLYCGLSAWSKNLFVVACCLKVFCFFYLIGALGVG